MPTKRRQVKEDNSALCAQILSLENVKVNVLYNAHVPLSTSQ